MWVDKISKLWAYCNNFNTFDQKFTYTLNVWASLMAAHYGGAMVKNGIDRIKISVEDLDASVAFFRDTMEMQLVATGELDAASMQALWDLPDGTTVRAAYLKNTEQSTLLELIQFAPNSGRCIREGAQQHDLGIFDVAFRAKDIDAVYQDFKAQGVEFVSAPVTYTADWANVTVKEVIFFGPNRMPIALIERLSEPKPVIAGRFGTLVDAAQFVTDMEQVRPFYTDVLGYTSVFDRDLPDGLIDEVLKLPAGTHSRMAFLLQRETNTPAVELIVCKPPGNSLTDVIGPTRLGLFGLVFEVGNILELQDKVVTAGYPVKSGPVELEIPERGSVRSLVVTGPNQALLEFFEKV